MHIAGSEPFRKKIRRAMIHASRDVRYLASRESIFHGKTGKRIIVYHGVCKKDHLRYNASFVTLDTFRKHLEFYKKHFNIVSLDDYYNGKLDPGRFNVCLTFDDGLANNHEYVLPLLEEYQAPAAFFITGIVEAGYPVLWNHFLNLAGRFGTPCISLAGKDYHKKGTRYISSATHSLLDDDLRREGFEAKKELINCMSDLFERIKPEQEYWLQMSERQIKELSRSEYSTIGCHGYYHNDLTRIPVAHVRDELRQNKLFLEKITGNAIHALAFPYGAYNAEVTGAAKDSGFDQLLAIDYFDQRDSLDETLQPRLVINPFLSVVNQMHGIVNGRYE
jgi:peptidoglycan/xylan/chitin deacetylase (PgdA/CDA1 family)